MLVECSSCEAIVDGELICEYSNIYELPEIAEKYSFLKCPKCSEPFLVLQIGDLSRSKDEIWDKPLRLYPPRDKDISAAIPTHLRLDYDEVNFPRKNGHQVKENL